MGDALHFVYDSDSLRMGENGWEGFGFFGADDVGGEFDLGLENMAVEEEDGTERLVSPAPTAGAVWVEAATFFSVARWVR